MYCIPQQRGQPHSDPGPLCQTWAWVCSEDLAGPQESSSSVLDPLHAPLEFGVLPQCLGLAGRQQNNSLGVFNWYQHNLEITILTKDEDHTTGWKSLNWSVIEKFRFKFKFETGWLQWLLWTASYAPWDLLITNNAQIVILHYDDFTNDLHYIYLTPNFTQWSL